MIELFIENSNIKKSNAKILKILKKVNTFGSPTICYIKNHHKYSKTLKPIKFLIFFLFLLLISNQFLFTNHIEYQRVTIHNRGKTLHGMLTMPDNYDSSNKYPGVVIFHGFSASKEMLRPFTEEFAKNNFIALTVDDIGAGESSPGLGENASLLSTGLIALNYLASRYDVDSSKIGLFGHSMGGSIVLETASNSNIPKVNVVLGNPIDESQLEFTHLNTTNPRNLLVGVGKYDELVSLDATKKNLASITGGDPSIKENVLYGDFASGTARKLIAPKTDHILEILNPQIIEESVKWMILGLGLNQSPLVNGISHSFHQALTVITYALVLASVIALSVNPIDWSRQNTHTGIPIKWHGLFSLAGFIFGAIFMNLLPVIFLGLFIGWFLFTSTLYAIYNMRRKGIELSTIVSKFTNLSEYGKGLAILTAVFAIFEIIFYYVPWDLRYAIPLLAYIPPLRIFAIMIPVLICGTILFEMDQMTLKEPDESYFESSMNTFWARSWPFIIILLIYYVPLITGMSRLPDILGFLTFFIVGFVPIIFALTFITEYPQFKHRSTLTGSIIAAGFLAWVLAATLPIS